MAKRRKYTDAERERAVALYVEQGPCAVEKQMGIAKSTVSRWAKKAGVGTDHAAKTREATEAAAEVAAGKRAEVRVKLLDKALDLMGRMDEEQVEYVGQQGKRVTYDRPNAADCKHYATAAAILIDKLRLEEGEATTRNEQITSTDFDREVAQLVQKVQEVASEA